MRLLGLLFAAIGGALIGFLLGLGVANAAPPVKESGNEAARPPMDGRPGLGSGRGLDDAGVLPVSRPPQVAAVVIRGTATWYCSPTSACTRGYGPSDLVAAIDPSLGIPKGTWLRVTHGGRSVEVRVVDVCACDGARIIDLTSGAFLRLAPLSRGVIQVSIEVLAPHATLPATDAEAGE